MRTFLIVIIQLALLQALAFCCVEKVFAQTEIFPDRLTVSTESVAALAFFPLRTAPADVFSLNASRIPAEISALVLAIPVRVGDAVVPGTLLAELDCRQTQLTYDIELARTSQLASTLEFDRRDLVRRQQLIEGGNIGEADLDRSQSLVINKEAQLKAQQAVQAIAELNTQRCFVRAPYSGIVTERLANEGETLALGQAVVKLLQLDELEVRASIALDATESFATASAYRFEENGNAYSLQLRSLLPIVEANARLRVAYFTFVEQTAVSGSSGRVVWETPQAHIPARFLQRRDNVSGVFIVDNNQAKFIPVASAQEGRPVPFTLPGTAMVVTDGRFGLVDGQLLNVR